MAFSKSKNTAPVINGVTGEVNIEVNAHDGDNVAIGGQQVAGRITSVSLTSAGWTALPTTPLATRNNITVQNISDNGGVVMWNYVSTIGVTIGTRIGDGESKSADLGPNIIVFGRMVSGSGTVIVDEVS